MGVKLRQKKKKTTQLPLFAHSWCFCTCNQTWKRKRRDNLNDIRESILWKTNLFPWKKCWCWQETNVTLYHAAREQTLVAKWNSLQNTLLQQCFQRCLLFQQAVHFPGNIHTKCHRTECLHFSVHNCVERSKL